MAPRHPDILIYPPRAIITSCPDSNTPSAASRIRPTHATARWTCARVQIPTPAPFQFMQVRASQSQVAAATCSFGRPQYTLSGRPRNKDVTLLLPTPAPFQFMQVRASQSQKAHRNRNKLFAPPDARTCPFRLSAYGFRAPGCLEPQFKSLSYRHGFPLRGI